MSSQLPIACTLTTEELPRRLSLMADLGREALEHADVNGAHARLRFAAAPGVRERVEAIVAAEAHCCAFLTMRISDAPAAVLLDIEAPSGAEPVLSELVGAFRAAA